MRENKKAEVLRLLRESTEYISGQELCEKFSVSRTAVWKIMKQLKEEGYEIEAVQNRGYRLLTVPDILSKSEIESRLDGGWIGKQVYFAEEVDSTNTWGKRLAEEGAPHGTLVVADEQTQGRGRRGRSWQSPKGTNISMTLILRPDLEPARASMLTIVMGLSVAQGLKELLKLPVQIKWPNDAVLNGHKLCGILTEMSAQIDYINYVVVGTGINVNLPEVPEELKDIATSLLIETGHRVNRAEVIGAVLRAFARNYESFLAAGDLTGLLNAYNEILANRDRQVRVLDPKEPYEGVALGINARGELLVKKADGSISEVYAGEVSVRGLYSYI
ncbi:MAG TPA: biotin--[acetyl-CoA-carboxylase] ligase [Candidatus Fusicatenibacter intestinigallinarum]|uniref:Bifunctional ligase/repressor BirA n=1 Tax=Candidatus Fusicatenibacter intestinigallinarum TaxID=2838598 RepID=A0A9D2N896_9FIRM|nr:biotin--[acetyl-CoA-carboxylase] ligase [Candidatus Fusicatenibacter intestinigallinarum]